MQKLKKPITGKPSRPGGPWKRGGKKLVQNAKRLSFSEDSIIK